MKSLKEVYNFSSKRILNEEIDYGAKKAIVYHLCGEKVGIPDPLDVAQSVHGRKSTAGDQRATYSFLSNQTADYDLSTPPEDTVSPEIRKDKRRRAAAIKRNITRGAFKKHYTDINSLQGKAHYLANSVKTDPYSTGSNFMAGGGKMYGKGLYTCYEFNPKIARTYGDVILRFEVDLTNYMIFTEDIAKKIHGENYRLEDQLKEILNRRGYDFERLSSDKGFDKFIDFLKTKTEEYPFKGSTIDTRTAPLCLETLQYCSYFTEEKILLRKLIEGVLFQGSGDGPVCIIYYPEIATNYILTGAGYFHPDTKEPIIHEDIEELAGRKSSIQLKDYMQIEDEELSGSDRQEILQDQIDQNKEVVDNYLNREPEEKEENLMQEINSHLTSMLNTKSNVSAISRKIIEKRDTFSNGKVLNSVAKVISNIIFEVKMLPSEIMAPVIPAIEVISGKKVDILSSEELIGYLENLRNTKIRRKRKFNSFEELKAGYEDETASPNLKFPLMTDENIDQKTLDLIWNAAFYIKTFKNISSTLTKRGSNSALIKIKTFVEGMDYGYLGPDFLQILNIKTEMPLVGGGFQFYEEGKEVSQSIGITHKHLNEIEEELPAIKSLISNIQDLLRRNRENLVEFNEACSDSDLYIKESFRLYNSYKIPPESFGLASFASAFAWPSCNIDIAMTFLYVFAEAGRVKNYSSIVESGNKVLVSDISPRKIFTIFGIDQALGDASLLDYVDLGDDWGKSSLYEWNMTNKDSIINSMMQSVKELLVNDFTENIGICLEMGTEEFLSSVGEGNKQLPDMKI